MTEKNKKIVDKWHYIRCKCGKLKWYTSKKCIACAKKGRRNTVGRKLSYKSKRK